MTVAGCGTEPKEPSTDEILQLSSAAGVTVPNTANALTARLEKGGWKNDLTSIDLVFTLTAAAADEFVVKTVPGAEAVDAHPRVPPCVRAGQTTRGSQSVNEGGTPRDVSGPIVDYFVTTGVFEGCTGFETRTMTTGQCRVTMVTKQEDGLSKIGIASRDPCAIPKTHSGAPGRRDLCGQPRSSGLV
ncbi:hypothetical protein [Tsukamurella sp. 1534]|uniref:hypothetical protein n=1 Tax=Tsukamurella sp. 1534 TaxID=1151061 RepID=UPI0011D2330F|nr:hypothetical protein [Tsukamurella sp. 1534]